MRLSPLTQLITGFSVSILILVTVLILSFRNEEKLYRNFDRVEHTYQVINIIKVISSDIAEIEGKVRGYYITSDNGFISEYPASIKAVYNQLDDLQKLTLDNPHQQQRIREWRLLIGTRINLFNTTIEYKRKNLNSPDLIRQKFNEARICMEQIKSLKNLMQQEEEFLLQERRKTAAGALKTSSYSFLGASMLSLLIAGMAFLVIRNDIKKRTQIEKQLRDLDANKNKFFSIISHDLRGPISGVSKLSKFLIDEKHKPTAQEAEQMAKLIEKSISKVSSLLDNLLKWSKMQMNALEFKPELILLKGLTEESLNTLHESALVKNINLSNSIEINAKAYGDMNMINTVIRNLVANAIKFTERGGKIIVHSREVNHTTEITIEDNGIGMTPEDIDRLFEITTKYSRKGTASEEGSGLGLLLCKEFVEKNGGKIWVESEVNIGSKFKFTLPRYPISA